MRGWLPRNTAKQPPCQILDEVANTLVNKSRAHQATLRQAVSKVKLPRGRQVKKPYIGTHRRLREYMEEVGLPEENIEGLTIQEIIDGTGENEAWQPFRTSLTMAKKECSRRQYTNLKTRCWNMQVSWLRKRQKTRIGNFHTSDGTTTTTRTETGKADGEQETEVVRMTDTHIEAATHPIKIIKQTATGDRSQEIDRTSRADRRTSKKKR